MHALAGSLRDAVFVEREIPLRKYGSQQFNQMENSSIHVGLKQIGFLPRRACAVEAAAFSWAGFPVMAPLIRKPCSLTECPPSIGRICAPCGAPAGRQRSRGASPDRSVRGGAGTGIVKALMIAT
jgi:hypothetical protein